MDARHEVFGLFPENLLTADRGFQCTTLALVVEPVPELVTDPEELMNVPSTDRGLQHAADLALGYGDEAPEVECLIPGFGSDGIGARRNRGGFGVGACASGSKHRTRHGLPYRPGGDGHDRLMGGGSGAADQGLDGEGIDERRPAGGCIGTGKIVPAVHQPEGGGGPRKPRRRLTRGLGASPQPRNGRGEDLPRSEPTSGDVEGDGHVDGRRDRTQATINHADQGVGPGRGLLGRVDGGAGERCG